jgi:hypothetical protein
MITGIRELIHNSPFVPFIIHTTDGRSISVPTVDHVAISGKFYAIVTHDDGKYDVIPALHISGVSVDAAKVGAA